MQKSTKEADRKGIFTLAQPKDKIPGSSRWFVAGEAQRNIVKELLEKRFHLESMESFTLEATSTLSAIERRHIARLCNLLLAEPEVWAWEFLSSHGDSFFFDLGDYRFRCAAITRGQHLSSDPVVFNVVVVGTSRYPATSQQYLYVGFANIPRELFRSTKGESSERKYALEKQLKKDGLIADGSVGGMGRQRGQQEGSSSSKRARKGKQQQQQPTNTDLRRARKGKQQQQPM
ncbi:hypothetical protein ACQY0O_006993 [Thecaphora frezii]